MSLSSFNKKSKAAGKETSASKLSLTKSMNLVKPFISGASKVGLITVTDCTQELWTIDNVM